MNIRVSRRTLRWIKRVTLGLIVIGIVTVGLYLLGRSITPRTAEGRPILFSPAVRAAETYRAQVMVWVVQFEQLNGSLAGLLDTTGDLYEQSARVNSALEQALKLAQDIELISAPTALAELRQMVRSIGQDYLAAAQAVATLINAPTPENQQAAAQTLEQAHQSLLVLQDNRWFTTASESVK